VGFFVVTLAGDRICAMTRVENTSCPGSDYRDRSQPVAGSSFTGWSGRVLFVDVGRH